MENFIVSARKYRPQLFNTVVGQSHITNTLKNAIIQKQLAQAYLFCGPRGVGKTTCARIFAKTINCFNVSSSGEACDTCDSCLSFNSGASLNVYELDAASNNSVEDIRNLVDQVRFAPQLGEYKVYIIDEVHMLSTAAFNAFLKTLEEPPKHAKFILATTEKHKIIPTILSRCQVFNFNRIKVEDISNHLAFMAEKEHVKYEQEALHIIAQKADGGLRDACSMFDQMVAFTGNNLTYKQVVENLHVLDYDYYFKLTDAFLGSRLPEIMVVFDDILKKGFDGHNFINGLGEHLRNILVSKDPQTLVLLEVSDALKQKYAQQSANCTVQFLLKSLSIISKADVNYKSAKNQRLLVEMALMQLCFLNSPLEPEKKNDESVVVKSETPVVKQNNPVITSFNNDAPVIKTASKPVIPFNQLKNTASFSLKDALTDKTLPNESSAPDRSNEVAYINEVLTLDMIKESVLKYAKTKQQNKSIYVSLTEAPVVLTPTNEILITLLNHSQLEKFQELKQDMLEVLRKDLKNNIIVLKFSIKEDDVSASVKAFTPKEKFKVMSEKNLALLELKKRFDLDIEY
ncbi:MAG: DNA polymerase III subunit gamma/tau [Bacteroidota bacterium]|nr:DNA polymerase III subunit gamma/tau [Bacteroidota bacterium]